MKYDKLIERLQKLIKYLFFQKKLTLTHTLHHLENRLLLECEYITY